MERELMLSVRSDEVGQSCCTHFLIFPTRPKDHSLRNSRLSDRGRRQSNEDRGADRAWMDIDSRHGTNRKGSSACVGQILDCLYQLSRCYVRSFPPSSSLSSRQNSEEWKKKEGERTSCRRTKGLTNIDTIGLRRKQQRRNKRRSLRNMFSMLSRCSAGKTERNSLRC